MNEALLIVIIILLIYSICRDMKGEKMCPYPGPQRFAPDPYNPINIGLLGQEACCGQRNGFACCAACGEKDNFTAGGCCGSCGTCLPTYPGCVPNNQLAGGQLPCESIGNFWFAYSRMIGDDKAWAILDAKGWPMKYEEALVAIPIGSVVCWNGQPMARVAAIKNHVNMPYSAFVVLDQSFKIDLSGQMVTIRPSNVF